MGFSKKGRGSNLVERSENPFPEKSLQFTLSQCGETMLVGEPVLSTPARNDAGMNRSEFHAPPGIDKGRSAHDFVFGDQSHTSPESPKGTRTSMYPSLSTSRSRMSFSPPTSSRSFTRPGRFHVSRSRHSRNVRNFTRLPYFSWA